MTKEKYSAFITEVSEILGLGKPVDIIKLCMVTDNFFKPLQKQIADLEKQNKELKEFYENEYFQIADRTADEKIKELEKHQVEVTVDDYSPYDPNTWGDMHEEWFVPKEEVRDLLKENYALITKAKEIIREVLNTWYKQISVFNGDDNEKKIREVQAKAEAFLKKDDNCPDMLCEDCTKTDCNIRKLGLVPDKKE